jgi:hypothetical protein
MRVELTEAEQAAIAEQVAAILPLGSSLRAVL